MRKLSVKACDIQSCTRKARSNKAAHCEMHYYRLRRTGEIGKPEAQVIHNQYDRCMIEDCFRKHSARALCEMHYTRYLRHGDPMIKFKPGFTAGDLRNPSRKEQPSYSAAHRRIAKLRGKARDYFCDCGNQAKQWSFIHELSENLLLSKFGAYSGNPNDYEALCTSCHKLKDLKRIKLKAES